MSNRCIDGTGTGLEKFGLKPSGPVDLEGTSEEMIDYIS